MKVSPDFVQKVVAYVEKVASEGEQRAATQQEYENAIPGVVDSLIATGLLDPMKKQAAVDALKDPRKALTSLQKTAEQVKKEAAKVADQTVKRMGKAEKSAGTRKTEVKEADQNFLRSFGF